ncbi:Multidrug resistance-associated protein 4 [Nymphon striatum]|nr:Multidrug resistance-associated protein 4 [Nymphon striatum]
MDHIHRVNQVIEKYHEYNLPLCLAFIDYKKAFDSEEHLAVLNALNAQNILPAYIRMLDQTFGLGTFNIKLHTNTNKIRLEKGVRQGDSISPKLFTACLENVFRGLNWTSKGIPIHGDRLSNLRFADDVVLFSESPQELQLMVEELRTASSKVGLEINLSKTKVMFNRNIEIQPIMKGSVALDQVDRYIYLGQLISIHRDWEPEVRRRVALGWQAFGRLNNVWSSKLPLCLKRKCGTYNGWTTKITFLILERWLYPTLKRGWKQELRVNDLRKVPFAYLTEEASDKFSREKASVLLKNILCSVVYKKVTKMSHQGHNSTHTGHIMNIVTNDINRFDKDMSFAIYAITAPVQCAIVGFILWKKLMKATDIRIKLINEIIGAMKLIKLYGWEDSFFQQLYVRRSVSLICRRYHIRYSLRQDGRHSHVTFIATVCLRAKELGRYGFGRVEFLSLEECNTECKNVSTNIDAMAPIVSFEGVHASWNSEAGTVLKNINFRLNRGQHLFVIGAIGSGKSTLLKTVLREVVINKGEMVVSGKVAYFSQESWLYSDTIRNNIIFGRNFNEEQYSNIIDACALQKDFSNLPHDDRTSVGERGVRMSGGQRARISLARAMYSDADIYLLDDPLSAVDPVIASHLYKHCIQEFLSEKILILVTHQVDFVKDAPNILFLRKDEVALHGTYNEITQLLPDLNNDFKLFKKEDITEQIFKSNSSEEDTECNSMIKCYGSIPKTECLENTIPVSVYMDYLRSAGKPWLIIFTTLILNMTFAFTYLNSDLWLKDW